MHVDIQPFAEYAVAPYVGAWIETTDLTVMSRAEWSHPTWVRGLKPGGWCAYRWRWRSHPTWVRGLKHREFDQNDPANQSHPTWVRGLKLDEDEEEQQP